MATIATLAINLIGNVSGLKSALGEAQQSIKATADTLNSVGTKMTAAVSLPILGVATSALQGAAEMEQLEVAFTTMLRSGDKAKALMSDLMAFAAETPFEMPEVVKAGKMLLAYGVEADNVQDTLRKLGDVAAGVGAPLEDMAFLFGTSRVQGRLFAADINQFTTRGIPIISALAKTMGVAEGSVKKMVEEGKVGFPELQKALDYMTTSGGQFEGLMAAQSQTLAGLFSTLKDTIGLSLSTIGRSIVEAFDLRTKLGNALEALGRVKDAIINLAETNPELLKMGVIIAAVAASIGPLLVGLGMVVGAVGNLVPVIGALASAFAFLVSPLGLVVAGLAALVVFDVGGIRTQLAGLVTSFMDYIAVVGDAGFGSIEAQEAIGLFPEPLQGIIGAIDQTIGAFQNYAEIVRDAGFGSIEAQEAIGLFPEPLQNVLGFVDQTIGAFQNYAEIVRDAGFGSIEAQEAIGLFPEPLQNVLGFVDQTIGAFQNYAEIVRDAGLGSIEAQEAISLFPEPLQSVLGFVDQTIGAFQNYAEIVRDAGFGSIEAQEAIGLFPETLQNVLGFIDQTIGAFQNYAEIVRDTGFGSIEAQEAISLFPEVFQTAFSAIGQAVTTVQTVWSAFVDLLVPSLDRLQTSFGSMTTGLGTLGPAFTALQDAILNVANALMPVVQALGYAIVGAIGLTSVIAVNTLAAVFEALPGVIEVVVSQVTAIINLIASTVSGMVQVVSSLLSGDFAGAWEGLKTIVSGVVDYMTTTLGNLGSTVLLAFGLIADVLLGTFSDLASAAGLDGVVKVIGTIDTAVDTLIEKLKNFPTTIATKAPEWVATLVAWLWPDFIEVPEWVATLVAWLWPDFIEVPTWVATLIKWIWPSFPTQPAWAATLVSWDWPGFISEPSWLSSLLDWEWPDLPGMPDWLSEWFAAGNNALGTAYWRGGATWVGESGPELVNLPRGSQVIPERQAGRMGSGGPAVLIQQAYINDERDAYVFAYQIDDLRRRRLRR